MANEEIKTTVGGTKKYKDFIFAVGRRRAAVTRIRVYLKVSDSLKFGELSVKKGDLVVNGKNIAQYFSGNVAKAIYEEPLRITNSLSKYAITARTQGGGMQAQLGAWVLGVSRALAVVDEANKPLLRKKGLLTRDPRVRERRKVGMGGKARRKRQSPKR